LISAAEVHPDLLVRESAVAALGSIGDPAGLPAVLRALEGKPALRRRAAVALAAFDDPRVDNALRECLADRDWQVREVAEELLGPRP
jgi:HEAT repeat protein